MDTILLKNVKLKWPFLAAPNNKGEFASNKYQVDLVLEGDNLEAVKKIINPRQKIKVKDGESVITLKSSVKPRVYNKIKAIMSDEDLKKVGNGSIAHVHVTQYDSKKFGMFAGLGSIKIIDVKEFSGDDDFGDAEDIFVEDEEELI
jgi:hypothetical protein